MSRSFSGLILAASLLVAAAPAFAALDAPTVEHVVSGHGKIVLNVTAGASGAPYGFAIYWMTQQEYDDYGSIWPDNPSYPGLGWAHFIGEPSINTFGGQVTSYILDPFETVTIEIGDHAQDTGVSTNTMDELSYGPTWTTDYVFCTFAIGGATGTRSTYSLNAAGATTQVENCTYTMGYWKNHPAAWPVAGLTLGSVNYTAAELMSILNQSVGGNGLVSLAHQLIAAKLNVANGANAAAIAAAIANADAQIGALVVPPVGAGYLAPASTSSLTQTLDDYNNGITGPGHCDNTSSKSSSWGKIKSLYR